MGALLFSHYHTIVFYFLTITVWPKVAQACSKVEVMDMVSN